MTKVNTLFEKYNLNWIKVALILCIFVGVAVGTYYLGFKFGRELYNTTH